jgi:hypothetical protein
MRYERFYGVLRVLAGFYGVLVLQGSVLPGSTGFYKVRFYRVRFCEVLQVRFYGVLRSWSFYLGSGSRRFEFYEPLSRLGFHEALRPFGFYEVLRASP